MKVGDYQVRWKHNVVQKKEKEIKGEKVLVIKELKKKSTDCAIYDKSGEVIAIGVAKCNGKEDKFNRHIGRKVSFSQAVSKIADRGLRTQLWDEFKKENKAALVTGS